jgi:hypothetical protein
MPRLAGSVGNENCIAANKIRIVAMGACAEAVVEITLRIGRNRDLRDAGLGNHVTVVAAKPKFASIPFALQDFVSYGGAAMV